TYLLHYLFAIAYGGGHGALHTFALHPAHVYTLARAAAAALGVLALWLTYLAGARLLGRAAGLLAAAIEAVAFLPVYYAHLALNDVPTLAPLALSLVGSAGVLRRGRTRDCLLAGAGLGLACATKYTAGIGLAPLLGALIVWRREPALGWLLVPAPLLFLVFMGLQGRYFGRWLLPVLPILCLLAALFALEVAGALARLARRAWQARPARARTAARAVAWRRTLTTLAAAIPAVALAAALLTQGLTYSIHSDLVLSRADTRTLTRAWMLA